MDSLLFEEEEEEYLSTCGQLTIISHKTQLQGTLCSFNGTGACSRSGVRTSPAFRPRGWWPPSQGLCSAPPPPPRARGSFPAVRAAALPFFVCFTHIGFSVSVFSIFNVIVVLLNIKTNYSL